jgi:hypothetical protein
MQKKTNDPTLKKLALNKTTIRVLTTNDLRTVNGGMCVEGSVQSRGVGNFITTC